MAGTAKPEAATAWPASKHKVGTTSHAEGFGISKNP
jgi:hypothetical protein